MIVDKRVRLWYILAESRWRLTAAVVWPSIVYLTWLALPPQIPIPVTVPALLGTVLSILMGFRTNSAYDRWWEARKVWGAIVNDSRSWARQVFTFVGAPADAPTQGAALEDLRRDLIYRQAAWNFALSHSLRKEDPLSDISLFLSEEERASLRDSKNVPAALLDTQGARLREMRARGDIDSIALLEMDQMLTRLCDSMGMCERIKNTVFPRTYAYLVKVAMAVFVILLPMSFVDVLGWMMIPVCFAVGGVFLSIENVAHHLQDPFENEETDTPMTALARTIEINLRQSLGETELPEPIQPVGGVLM